MSSFTLMRDQSLKCDFPHLPFLDNPLIQNSLRLANPAEATTAPQGFPTPYNGVEND